jgi:CBS domain containing-hemolysin-like protein
VTAAYLIAGLFLLLLNGFFVACEFAFIAVPRTRIDQLVEQGNKRALHVQRSVRQLSLMLAGAQLGITIASLGLGAVAEPAVAHLLELGLESVVDLPSGALHSISFVIALGIVVFLHMVIGEMAPKNLAIARPEQSALWLAAPMRAFVFAFRPLIAILNAVANGFLRLVGVEPTDELQTSYTAQEIRLMVRESQREGLLKKFEEQLLSGALDLGGRDAASVMVPRTEMTAVAADTKPAQLEQVVVESGHSRIPIYVEDLDHVIGFFHIKDLLRISAAGRERALPRRLIRQMLVVPESRKLQPLLFDMRRERRQLALVIDEHGGTSGVVSLEDLLEELVGEIRDEHDITEMDIERLDDGRVIVPGSYRISDLQNRLGIELPEGDYETVAGFIMDRLGRIPKRMDTVEHNGHRFRVQLMHKRRVMRVLIDPNGAEPAPPSLGD